MLAADAPWWKGEFGNLPHAPGDNRPAYQNGKPTGANAKNWRPRWAGDGQYPARPQAQGGASGQPDSGSRQWSGGTPSFNERAPSPPSGKAIDMSAYRPGQAQPVAQASQGTPYRQVASNPPQAPAYAQQGGYAAAQPPAPFQMGAAQTPWGPSMDPFADRDAMIRAINEQRVQRQIAFNTGGTSPMNPGAMPWLDYGSAIQQAGLGQGSPSMSPEYGDSLIGRLNQQYGQPLYRPPAPGQGQPSPSQPMLRPMSADEWRAAGSPPPRNPPPSAPPAGPTPLDQGRKRSPAEIAEDFYDPNPGGIKLMVVTNWYNPQTGESYASTGTAPRPGTGWVKGVSPERQRQREEEYMRLVGRQAPAAAPAPQPVPPPSQGTPYQPSGPKAAEDVTKLPFYKSLFVGDTVRASPRRAGEYDVFDSSGRHVESYVGDQRTFYQGPKGGRTGNRMWDVTPEGSAENARRLQELKVRDEAARKDRLPAALKEYEALSGWSNRMGGRAFGKADGEEYRKRTDALRRNFNELTDILPPDVRREAIRTGFIKPI